MLQMTKFVWHRSTLASTLNRFWLKCVLGKDITYATLGKVVVKSKNMLAVVEALDVVAPGGVVGAPGIHDIDDNYVYVDPNHRYMWFMMWSPAGRSLGRFGSGWLSVMLLRK